MKHSAFEGSLDFAREDIAKSEWSAGHLRRFTSSRTLYLLLHVGVACSLITPGFAQGKREISDDRDLKELDLTKWGCLNKPEGTARTPDGQERNRLKGRSVTDVANLKLPDLDVAGFIQSVNSFDKITVNTRRKDLSGTARQQLDPMEKQIAQVTGYLGVAYCGPPETTNCASVDFHDWHLEIFEKPPTHPPQPGDPTPIICEITPRTQNAIFADKIRIQELTAFFRRADLEYESTGHPARKIRLIGYRLWDDEHNGSADVGTAVSRINPNKFHNPWRQTAWELHPVVKIIPIESPLPAKNQPSISASPAPSTEATPSATPAMAPTSSPAPTTSEAPLPALEATASPPPAVSTPPVTPALPETVTIVTPVKIKILYGETVLPRGAKLPLVSREGESVKVRYLGETYSIPSGSTDVK
ncbi:MAG TPA: hypothetical protein VGM62_06465 [Chthoniobacterales bacterium]